ncbi:MAG: hypothetical protein IJO94_06370, partial [Firmicutes bacterium]|nr:hypothetical protein [Bacillota bacterium]
ALSGAKVQDTVIKAGGILSLDSGTVHKGVLTIENGAFVNVQSGVTVDFTLAGRTENDDYLINDLAAISGNPVYTITLDMFQQNGIYKLAGGAYEPIEAISIGTETVKYGLLQVNGAERICNSKKLSLNQYNGDLTLTISGESHLYGDSKGVTWEPFDDAEGYIVEYSQGAAASGIITIKSATNSIDSYALPSGSYHCCARKHDGEFISEKSISAASGGTPQKFVSDADGDIDLFFGRTHGVWNEDYVADHLGIMNGWKGTGERILLDGKNKIADVFNGSSDANILVLTDDSNGDALFVDDIYTAFGKDAARISQIDEIRAGAGADIVDLTSQKFAYAGEGVKVYGGLGNDTIWANQGKNILFGDAGNDRIVGGSDNDVIAGGIGNDSMHGGGGEDIFTFGGNWGKDTITQLADGKVTLWFEDGSASNWNASTLTYTDGENSVKVTGIASDKISLKFGGDTSDLPDGAFAEAASEKIFEDKNKGMLA